MRFSVSDGVVTVLTALIATYLLVSFWSDLGAITSRGDETPLGTVTFKKQTATRRSVHSQVWERLQNQSPVYESDTLRTADASEAVIRFDDGLALELQENTMLRLTLQGRVRTVDFTEGSVTLQGGGSGTVALGQSGRTLTLSADAQLVLTKKADTVSLELAQGTASVSDAQGSAQALSTLQALDLDTKTGTTSLRTVDLVPRSPAPGGRLVDQAASPTPVEFLYQIGPDGPSPETVEVQISDRPDFSVVVDHRSGVPTDEGANRANLNLAPGTWYWRVSAPGGTSAVRSFTLFREAPPTLVSPGDGAQISYRKVLPSVPFSWSASDLVSSWVFELSRSADFQAPEVRKRTNLTRLAIDNLDEGLWYWRVVPVSVATVISPPNLEVHRLSVVRRQDMAVLQPDVPVEGTVVQTQDLATKGLAFTWTPVAEAQSYQLTVRDGTAASARVLGRFTATTPYLLLTPDQLGSLAGEGLTYWDLRWQDDEGNLSPQGPSRTLRTVEGAQALRPTFPPDGYVIADQLVTNTRFGWKSNLALKTSFQVSRQKDFAQLVYEAPGEDGTKLGKAWGLGTFYWRVLSFNANGTVFLQTDPRRFDVLGPLSPARLVDPPPGTTLSLPEGMDREISWSAVPGAESYRVTLSDGKDQTVRFQAEVDPKTQANPSIKVPFSRLPEGPYLVKVQGFHRETDQSTAVLGLYGEGRFESKRLFFPQRQSPPDDAVIEGLTALRQGLTFAWTTPTPLGETAVIVSKNGVPTRLPASGNTVSWSRVLPGEYTWTVTGSASGFELTAPAGRFVVATVPPLPAPTGLNPGDQTVWGPSSLKTMKTFDLSWDPVDGARGYVVTVYRDEEVQPVLQTTVSVPKVSLEKGKYLQKGGFRWTVEARAWAPDGSVEQPGVAARAGFRIELPVLAAPTLPEEQTFYGR